MIWKPGITLIKDPHGVLPYEVDWTDWLGAGAEIASSSWHVDTPDGAAALTLDNDSDDGFVHTVRISGGTLGKTYVVTSHVETNETPSRTDDRSFNLRIRET